MKETASSAVIPKSSLCSGSYSSHNVKLIVATAVRMGRGRGLEAAISLCVIELILIVLTQSGLPLLEIDLFRVLRQIITALALCDEENTLTLSRVPEL